MLSPTPQPVTNLSRSNPQSASVAHVDANTLLEQLTETCVEGLSGSLQARQPLNLQQLAAFEVVTNQFAAWGVAFAGAIALAPSNPKFIDQPGQKVLMPAPVGQTSRQGQSQHQMQLWCQPMVTRICLAGRSTQPIALEVLDATGAVVAIQNGVMCPLPSTLQLDTSRLPSQVFKLDLPKGGSLRLSAKAPFVLFNVAG